MSGETDLKAITEEVVEALDGQTALGRSLGVKQQVVQYWVKKGKRFPAEFVLHIERLVAEKGLSIDRYDLRPDVYGARPSIKSDNNAA
jgi:DNA-binding transcriptional regulator YdaS (Cro superfamily)